MTKKPEENFSIIFDSSPITRDTGFHGLKLDFNYGVRLELPAGEDMHIRLTDTATHTIIFDYTGNGVPIFSEKKYYIPFKVEAWFGDEYYEHTLDLEGKNVLIKFPTGVMGDILSWFPYVTDFKAKHKCNLHIYMEDYMRDIIAPNYPDLIFVDEKPEDCYATYYLGIFFPPSLDRSHQPMDFRHSCLSDNAARILDLPILHRPTKLSTTKERQIKEKYVCIAVQATTQCKCWNNPSGWIDLIDYLKGQGYRVLCIDKARIYGAKRWATQIPYGCEDFTGSIPLQERINLLAYADFFVGVSSGLSWLAHCIGTPVVMISGFTYPYNEFDCYRVINFNACTGCWHDEEFVREDYGWCPRHKGTEREFECSRMIGSQQVIDTIERLRKEHNLL